MLDIRLLDVADVARVHELSQRTNQLNFTGAKLALAEVEAMAAPDTRHLRLTLRCADRWGDYGLIGFAELDLARGALARLFMSCRVQRKRVEARRLRPPWPRGCRRRAPTASPSISRATERNAAAVRLLEDLGFTRDGEGWTRALATPFPDSDVVRLAGAPIHAAAA